MHMDRTKGPLLASATQEPRSQVPAPKLRNKLQKVKRPGLGAPNEASNSSGIRSNKFDTPPKISLPLSPDLGDSKWAEYLRSSGYLCASLDALPHPERTPLIPPATTVPELSYLVPHHDTTPRSSVDTLGSESTEASAVSVRRYAKTPVLHIGQLEAKARARKLEEANRRVAQMREAMDDLVLKQADMELEHDAREREGSGKRERDGEKLRGAWEAMQRQEALALQKQQRDTERSRVAWEAFRKDAESRRARAAAVPFQLPPAKNSRARGDSIKETNTKEATTNNVTVRETNVREVFFSGNSRNPSPRIVAASEETSVQEMLPSAVYDGGVNRFAEQYKALIAPDESRFTESRPETPPSRREGREGPTIRHKRNSPDLRRESQEFAKALQEPAQTTPGLEGSLVAFEEDRIYFKPYSLSRSHSPSSPAGPSSPVGSYETPMTSPLPTPNNIGLKICVDLLAKDLASTVAKTDEQKPEAGEGSALQIWTMIEGYEKLRDRILESGLGYAEVTNLEQSLDTWLQALYAAHDRLTRANAEAESVYDNREGQGV